METMFCLVSRQTMANVLPVLMYKPTNVVLFATPEESKSANNLIKLFKRKKINVDRINNIDAYNYPGFKNKIIEYIEKYNNNVVLNVTGGTKLMALGAYEIFHEKKLKIIYCDTEHKNIIFLSPDYKKESLSLNLSIEDYLLSYGYEIINKKDNAEIENYFDLFDFIDNNKLLQSLIDLFKKIIESLNDERPTFTEDSGDKKFQFQKIYDKYFIRYGDKKEKSLKIDSSYFKTGDWLENYTYYKIYKKYDIKPYLGVEIASSENVKNEIDLLVLNNYKLYLFSCKSGKNVNNKENLYELNTLKNITSGTFGKAFYVTANFSTFSIAKRAKELNIEIIDFSKSGEIEL